MNEPPIEEKSFSQPWVSTRERELRAALLRAFEAQKGNSATRLWNAVVETWPPACVGILDWVGLQHGRGGRRWADLWRLVDVAEDRLETLEEFAPDTMPDDITGPYRTTEAVMQEVAVAVDALRSCMAELAKGSMDGPRDADLWDTCHLCWRYGVRSQARHCYCVQHVPTPANRDYKRGLALLNRSAPSGPGFYQRYRSLRLRIRTGLVFDAPSLRVLAELQFGEPAREVPRYLFRHGYPWAKLPALSRALVDTGNVPKKLKTPDVFDWLCPASLDNTNAFEQIKALYVRDERLLLNMMIRAEAWISSSDALRNKHGGARR